MISAEDVVRRLGRQPGYRLLTYRDVGLPFWEMPLRCRVLGKKALPTIDEFVLRCVEAGLAAADQVSRFLGLPAPVAETVMGSLVASGQLSPSRPTEGSETTFVLSLKGRQTLQNAGEVVPQERHLRLAYDGIVREFSVVPQEARWRPRDLRENEILELPAFPADPPEVGPSDTSMVATALASTMDLAQHDLLSVLGLAGKREKFFVRAVAMIFQSVDATADTVVKFAIDGRPSEKHDQAFARAEGQRKLGISQSLLRPQPQDEILGEDILQQAAGEEQASALRRATDSFRARLDQAERRLATSTRADDEQVENELNDLRRKVETAEAALARLPARLLEVHEHPALLDEALTSARDRLLLVSPWIRAAVVDEHFLSSVRELLERGVTVSIGYGIDDSKPTSERDRDAEARLSSLAKEYSNLSFVRLGDTHAKVLVVDDRFVVVTSFNWLSFKGDARRPFRDERGTLVTIPAEIERIYGDYVGRMSAVESRRRQEQGARRPAR